MSKKFLIGYTFFLSFFSVFSYLFIDPNLHYLNLLYKGLAYENRSLMTSVYIVLVIFFFIFYRQVILHVYKKNVDFNLFKILIIITTILLLSYPAMISYDIFNYIATAKTLFFYKENPYVIMPIEFAGDPILEFTRAANKFALYGPTWTVFTGIPFLLGFENFVIILFNMKLFIFCFYLGTIFVLYKLCNNWNSPILFALNPLVVIETLISSHNDIVMIFLLLTSFLFFKKKKNIYGVLFFLFSVFVKFATIILLPIIILILWFYFKRKEIQWNKIYYFSGLLLLIVFLLSPLREELYPWYFIWILPFVYLLPQNRKIVHFASVLSFGLLLQYIPYMYSGTYSGFTPIIRNILMTIPLLVYVFFLTFKKNI